MDKDVVQAKLEMLTRCIIRIKSQNIASCDELEQDFDKQDIIILNLQRSVQICVDIANHILLDYESAVPSTMAESFKYLAQSNVISMENAQNLARAVGFRNIAVRQYEDIDCNIIYAIITEHLADFTEFAKFIEALYNTSSD